MAKKIIPRILHTAWFGGAEKPDKIKMCMESWKRHLPNWEFIEWNENNFDLSPFPFAQEALRRKRYAFVADIVRLKCLLDNGGVYVDADVEILKSLDRFLVHRAFTCHETSNLTLSATMGAEKNHPWLRLY
jgi:mannosyltransferase OCH1-like enzyme